MYLAPYGPKEFGLSESAARSGKASLAQRFTLDRLWPQRAREHSPGFIGHLWPEGAREHSPRFTLVRLWPKGPGEHSPRVTLGRLWPEGPGEHSPGFTLGIPPTRLALKGPPNLS
jgi:hypothetical protein